MTTLRFPATDAPRSWGLNFSRESGAFRRTRTGRRSRDSFRVYKMSRAGTLTSLEGIRQGRNLWVKPFVNVCAPTVGASRRRAGLSRRVRREVGITPQLTLDVTALTDFSQVEVDEQQINLTRFSLFFPEKRDFFLENDGIFSFQDNRVRNFRTGSGTAELQAVPQPPHRSVGGPRPGAHRRWGTADRPRGRLRDRPSQHADPGRPGGAGENFSVVRLRKNILGSSDVGFMFVNREGTGASVADLHNRSLGTDVNLRLAGGRMLLNSYLAATDEPDVTGDRLAGAFEVAWRIPCGLRRCS